MEVIKSPQHGHEHRDSLARLDAAAIEQQVTERYRLQPLENEQQATIPEGREVSQPHDVVRLHRVQSDHLVVLAVPRPQDLEDYLLPGREA